MIEDKKDSSGKMQLLGLLLSTPVFDADDSARLETILKQIEQDNESQTTTELLEDDSEEL